MMLSEEEKSGVKQQQQEGAEQGEAAGEAGEDRVEVRQPGFDAVLTKFYDALHGKVLETLRKLVRGEVDAAYVLIAPPETYLRFGDGGVSLSTEPVFAPVTVKVSVEDSKTVVTNLAEILGDYIKRLSECVGEEAVGKKLDIGIDPLGMGTALFRYTIDASVGLVSRFEELRINEAVAEVAKLVLSKAGRKARKNPMEYAKFIKWLKMRKLLTRKFPKSLRGLDDVSVQVLFTFALIGNSLIALKSVEEVEELKVRIYPVTPAAKVVWDGDNVRIEATRFTGYAVVEVRRYERSGEGKDVVGDVIRRVLESVRAIMPHGIDALLKLYLPASLSPEKVSVGVSENVPLPKECIEAYMTARAALLPSVAPPHLLVEVLEAVKESSQGLSGTDLICEAYVRVMEYAFSRRRVFSRRFVKKFADAIAEESRKLGSKCLMVKFNAVAPKVLDYIVSTMPRY